MGLMFSRRRAEAQKVIEANKAKAHAENHAARKAEAKAKKEEKKADGADKPRAK